MSASWARGARVFLASVAARMRGTLVAGVDALPDRPGLLQIALRRERAAVALALLTVTGLSWAYLFAGAGMSMAEMDSVLMPMRTGPVTAAYALVVIVMWAVMMAAMMLPSAAPMILFFDAIARRRAPGQSGLGETAAFVAGYLVVWAAFSIAAALLQVGFEAWHLVDAMMQAQGSVFAGLLLAAAGLYQWSPLKQACLRACRSPLSFVLTQWDDGPGGAFRMGLRHGATCVGCCWALMLVLLVGGVMSLAWVGGIALLVLVEKVAPTGPWLSRAAGAGLLAWGGGTLAGALLTELVRSNITSLP